jgi:taurine dioxygenase
MEIEESTAPVGAEIIGVDLSQDMTPDTFAKIEAALNKHSVIVFRDQTITPDQQLAFSDRFGALEINAFSKFALPDHPGILKVSNIKENGVDIGFADAGSHWHSDMSYTAHPPRCTILYAIEVPIQDGKVLGETLFASTAAAYDTLSDDMKSRLDGLIAIHRFAAKERGVKAPLKLSQAQIDKHPDVRHPVARTHPNTGRKCLYVRQGECVAIDGMDDEEATALIKELSDLCVEDRFIYRHKWRVGDVLMWDNCALQHIALRDYEWPQRRMMHRTTVGGAVPV